MARMRPGAVCEKPPSASIIAGNSSVVFVLSEIIFILAETGLPCHDS